MNQLCSLAGMATVKTNSAANQDQAPNQNPKWSTAAGSLSVFLLTDDMLCKMCPSVFYYLKHGGKKKNPQHNACCVCTAVLTQIQPVTGHTQDTLSAQTLCRSQRILSVQAQRRVLLLQLNEIPLKTLNTASS